MSNATFSPGLAGVVAGHTQVSAVQQSSLSYRGYPIEQLAGTCGFEEVAYLLLHDDLPNAAQLRSFEELVFNYRSLPSGVVDMIRLIPKQAPMMDVLRTTISAAGHFDPVKGDSPDALRDRSAWLLATAAGILAARYRLLNGNEPVDPKPGLSHAAQILYQCEGAEPDATSARLLDLTLILYAEHEFNASTFTNRVICSTMSDMVSAIVGAIGALKGPLHGGANERAMEMLKQFDSAEQSGKWIADALAKKEKVMGFGHRVYKHGDHRAVILEEQMRTLAEQKGQTRWVDIYDAIKKPMVEQKNIFPNVDYPCGLTYYLLGLPLDLYTPLFVCSRVTGWCAHYMEQAADNRIYRPLSEYVGPQGRKVVPIDQR